MSSFFDSQIDFLINGNHAAALAGGLKGIEKESLRIDGNGHLSTQGHPEVLGSALTHASITTDYSEALLELITPAFANGEETLDFLSNIHRFVAQEINPENFWCTSMPCAVSREEQIPIALYGSSNVGQMKHVYRKGLALRYGKMMQIIAGTHFNYSLPDSIWPLLQQMDQVKEVDKGFIAERYFRLIRNVLRLGWLPLYLFGASPAVCRGFVRGQAGADTQLLKLDEYTYHLPYATSLRMSDIGYKSNNQASLRISYNQLDEYVKSLTEAIETPLPAYQNYGVRVDGEFQQLNDSLLQIENEYYSVVRPKQLIEPGEKPTVALCRRGVAYVELRALDLDPFSEIGIDRSTTRFLEAFLLYCALEESPPMSGSDYTTANKNQLLTATQGRDKSLRLEREGSNTGLSSWASEVLSKISAVAELLDQSESGTPYQSACEQQQQRVADSELTGSAIILRELREQKIPFCHYALDKSKQHMESLLAQPLAADISEQFKQETIRSMEKQKAIEAADSESFADYLSHYFAG